MSLRDRIPVEPLDSARLDRLEQRVIAQARPALTRPRRAPWAPWLVAGSAALAAAAVVIALGVGRHPAPAVAPAVPPTSVATDQHGTRVELGDAVVEVGPDTRFEVVRAGGGLELQLGRGDVTLEVPPRRGRPPLWVHAGDVGVRVVGTGFRVSRHDTVVVEVTHGVVEVHRADVAARVATGERWSSTDGAVVAIAALAPGDRAGPGAGADPSARSTIPADRLALGGSADGPTLRDRQAPAFDPGGAGARPVAGPSTSPRPVRVRPAPAAGDAAAPPVTAVRPPPDLRAEVMAQPVAPAPLLPPGKVVASADERARIYRELSLSKQRRDDADGALWGLAHTQATALRQEAEALRTLDYYVRRFPSGGQLEAVLWLRLRLLCARGIDAPCRAAAHTYVARFPGGSKGELAIRVTNTR